MAGSLISSLDPGSILTYLPVLFAAYLVLWLLFLDPLRKIPGPWYARISSAWLVRQCRLGRRAKAVHQQHLKYGNIVRIANSHVSVNDPEALHEIFGHDREFPKGPWYNTFRSGDPLTTGLVALYHADVHRDMRKDMATAFSPRTLREFESRMSQHHLEFIESIRGQVREGGDATEIDLNPWVNLLAFDIVAEFSFGKPFGFLEKGHDDEGLMWALSARGKVANAIGNTPTWIRPYLTWIPFDDFWRTSARAIAAIKKLSESATEERISGGEVETKDLMSYMLSAKSTGGESWSREKIFNQATQTVIAGSDSTAASTAHLIDFLSRHPHVQKRVQKELDEKFSEKPDAEWVPLDADNQDLSYTRAVVHEVLRLTPTAASGFERIVTQPGTKFAGYDVPVGTLVSVPTWTLHHTESIYPDPESFQPERWMGDDASGQQKNWNLFSQGPRNCIGKSFAMMEILKTIVLLFRWFEVQRANYQPTEYDEGFFLHVKECRVRIRKRS